MSGMSVVVLIGEGTGGADIDSGARSVEDVLGGGWTMSPDRARELDYLVAVRDGRIDQVRRVIGVADTEVRPRGHGRRLTTVIFDLAPAPELSSLVGQPVPAGRMRNPVKYVDTERLIHGDRHPEQTTAGRRVLVEGFTLTVDEQGHGELLIPEGGSVTVRSAPPQP